MEYRKQLHAKIAEMQNGLSYDEDTSEVPFEDLIWKVFEDARLKLDQLSRNPFNHSNVDTYLVQWNQSAWSLLDLTVMLSVASTRCPSAPWQRGDYRIRRTIQELLIVSNRCSPVWRLLDQTLVPVQCRSMVEQYHSVKIQLDGLNAYATGGGSLSEETMREMLGQFHTAVSVFCNQYVPNLLHAEAVKVRSSEKQYHPISQAKQTFKFPDQLDKFRILTDWAFSLVGSLLSRSIAIVNEIFLYPQTKQYASLMAAELSNVSPMAVIGLCKFLLWVSTHPPMILVTRTEFACHCLLLNNYFVSGETVKVQVVSEATARAIQDECFRQSPELGASSEKLFPSAGVLARKDVSTAMPPASSKRKKRSFTEHDLGAFKTRKFSMTSGSMTSNVVEISLMDNDTYRIPMAEADSMLCTDRFMSDQDGGANEKLRDIYYLHARTTVSIFNINYSIHTLSLPFVIPTRKNQDLQLHRMLKSYSATIFWLHVAGEQDGFVFAWKDHMQWTDFAGAFNVYFTREARTARPLSDFDFVFLREKMKCDECSSAHPAEALTFQNIICPHLVYHVADKPPMKYSVWRALLDLIQLFQNERTKLREMWDKRYVGGLWPLDSVTKIHKRYSQHVLIARISLLSSGSVVFSFNSFSNRIVHTEPLDQQRLSRRNLIDCVSDLVQAESIIYVLDDQLQPHSATMFITESLGTQTHLRVKANADHFVPVKNQREYTFHALKLAMVACGVERCSSESLDGSSSSSSSSSDPRTLQRSQSETEFNIKLKSLLRRYGRSNDEAIESLRTGQQKSYEETPMVDDDVTVLDN